MAIEDGLPNLPVVNSDTTDTILEALLYSPSTEHEFIQEISDQIMDENPYLYNILTKYMALYYASAKEHGADDETIFTLIEGMMKSYVIVYSALDNQLEAIKSNSKIAIDYSVPNLPIVNSDTVDTIFEDILSSHLTVDEFIQETSDQIKDENPLLYSLLSKYMIDYHNHAKEHGADDVAISMLKEGMMKSYSIVYSALENQLEADFLNERYTLGTLGKDFD